MALSRLFAMVFVSGLVIKMIANGSIMGIISALTELTRRGLAQVAPAARGLSGTGSPYIPGAYRG